MGHVAAGIDYEKELNPQQLEVVLHGDGPILVIAGAGTGKTKTLVHRVARLVESGVPPESVLLLTFTRKAASEMIGRASHLLGGRGNSAVGGTFHSFAATVLRTHAEAVGFTPRFTILDRSDSEALIGHIRSEAAEKIHVDKRFPQKSTLAGIISMAANHNVPIEKIVAAEYQKFYHLVPAIEWVRQRYAERKKAQNQMDFDDLLMWMEVLLRDHHRIRERLSDRHRYILVDEYQDTNLTQGSIMRLLAATHDNVTAVGDDAQSIYAFRGARIDNIFDFPKAFPGTKLVTLEENYRSQQPILNMTNEIIARATRKYPKRLYTSKRGGKKPLVMHFPDEREQSDFVIDQVGELQRQGVPLREIAVLFRSGFLSTDLEIGLTKKRIPFRKFGGLKITEAAHIKDFVAHLTLLENPRDDVSLSRALLLIPGVGRKAADAVIDLSAERGGGLKGLLYALENHKKSHNTVAFRRWLEESGKIEGSVFERASHALRYYRDVLEERYDDHVWRYKDLEQLVDMAERYNNLGDLLSDFTLDPPDEADFKRDPKDDEEQYLTLSTVHSAKGLEWSTVFIIWALDGRFPSTWSLETPSELEEERRLFYVAATRAKRMLYITYPTGIWDRATAKLLTDASRFIDDLPDEVLMRQEW